jgi:Xaa-Pro dipeptidase
MVQPGGPDDLIRAVALLLAGHEPVLIVDELFAANANPALAIRTFGTPPLMETFRPADRWADDQISAIAAALRQSGADLGTIAIERAGCSPRWQEAIRAALPRAQLRDCSALLRLIRVVKNDAHSQHVAELTALADHAAREVTAAAVNGTLTLGDLSDIYAGVLVAARTGASLEHLALGLDGGITTRRESVLPPDGVSYFDHGCRSAWGVSDRGTTLALRQLERPEADALECVTEAIETAEQMLEPGVRSSAIHAAMCRITERYPGASPQGHGIGIEIREDPIIAGAPAGRLRDDCVDESADLTLEPGMIINVEASLFRIGPSSVHIEETFIVHEQGATRLSSSPFVEASRA